MRWIAAYIFALGYLGGAFCSAQDITGVWQGELPKSRRVVVKVSRSEESGDLKALMYSIDEAGHPMPASAISVEGTIVKMAVPGIGITYEGKLSADHNSIVGEWTQLDGAVRMVLTRTAPEAAWDLNVPTPMAQNSAPVLEKIKITRSKTNAKGMSLEVKKSGIFATANTSVHDLIKFSYDLHPAQLLGGAAWLASEKYDISGEPNVKGIPSHEQLQTMVRKLLADQFQLRFHREKQNISAYILNIAGSPKLTENTDDRTTLPFFGGERAGDLNVRNATISDFASALQGHILDRPVLDQTGLKGRYDFTLIWKPDVAQLARMGLPATAATGSGTLNIFEAIQQQLGLDLELAPAFLDVLVIDHAEQ
jgi:uncharacterized protein (TIGR03435 family)